MAGASASASASMRGDGANWTLGLGLGKSGSVPGCGLEAQSEPETLVLVRYVIYEVLVPILVPFGILANSLNVVVLTRKWMRTSTNVYLTALAVYDSLYLLFAFFMAFSAYPSVRHEHWYVLLRRFVQPMTNVFSNTAVWIVVTFSCERYVAISYPIKGRRWCTISKAKRIVLAVCVVCLLLTAPEFFSTRLHRRDCPINNTTTTSTTTTTTFRLANNEFHAALDKYGYYYANSTLFAYLPLFLLTVCNFLLIRAILRSRQLRKSMTLACRHANSGSGVQPPARNGAAQTPAPAQAQAQAARNRCSSGNAECERQNFIGEQMCNGASESSATQSQAQGSPRRKSNSAAAAASQSQSQKKEKGISEQNRLTLMLVIVVVAFLCCHLPSAIGTSVQSYIRYREELRRVLGDALRIYGNISNLLVQLNTASNFILYSMLSTKFRMTFRKIFCRCILSEQDSKILSDRRSVSVYTNRTAYELQSNCSALAMGEKRSVGVLRPAGSYEAVKE